jgi:excisionase family DNA binding protein
MSGYPGARDVDPNRAVDELIPMSDDEILTVAQVADQFGVTPQTVRAWIGSGKLKGGRVGKAYRILRRDVYAMVEQAAIERQSREREQPIPIGSSEPIEVWAGVGSAGLLIPRR